MYTLQINNAGHIMDASYNQDIVLNTFIPLLHKWTQQHIQTHQRILVVLAAPPGAGKSTLGMFLEELSKQIEGIIPIQCIGMDGFHRYQDYLDTHTMIRDGKEELMAKYKGAKETFDVDKLIEKIKQLKESDISWPTYNRVLHNPQEDAIHVTSPIVLLEGNYLLLKEEPWNTIKDYSDETIYLTASLEELEKRLIARKMKGGIAYHRAIDFVQASDLYNARIVENNSMEADICFQFVGERLVRMK